MGALCALAVLGVGVLLALIVLTRLRARRLPVVGQIMTHSAPMLAIGGNVAFMGALVSPGASQPNGGAGP